MMEKKRLLMEFGLRALMEQIPVPEVRPEPPSIPVPKPRPEVPRSPYNKSFSIFGLPVGEVQKDGTFFTGDYTYRNLPLPSQSEKGTLDPNYNTDWDDPYRYLETMPTPTGSRERPVYADPSAMDELHPHIKFRDGKMVSIGNIPIPQSRPEAPAYIKTN